MSVSDAVVRLSQAMQANMDLAWSWHSNIAVCALDEGASHEVANRAAARAMKLLFDTDVTKSRYWKNCEYQWNSQEKQDAKDDQAAS